MRTLIFISLFTLLTACGSAARSAATDGDVAAGRPTAEKAVTAQPVTPLGTGSGSGTEGVNDREPSPAAEISVEKPSIPPAERKIIRDGSVELEADSPEDVQQKIAQIAETKGGYVVEAVQRSTARDSKTRDVVTMSIRIPADKFAESMEEISKTGNRLISQSIKGTDVTEEFLDVEARLTAKKALEQQFLEIMKRANTVEDALKVQRELAEVRGEIEKIEGRKRFLADRSALSTIATEIRTPAAFAANSQGFWSRLKDAFSNGIDFALDFILGLVSVAIGVLPFILFIVAPIFLFARYLWRRWRRRKAAQPTTVEIVEKEIAADK